MIKSLAIKLSTGNRLFKIAGLVISGCAVVMFLAAWIIPLPMRMKLPSSRVVEYADGTPMCVFLSPDDKWRIPASIGQVDPDYIAALLAYEDRRFYHHPGVDPLALGRAVIQNIFAGQVVSGASTITMQVVRIMEPRPRTFCSKFIEMLRALQLDLRLSKDEILAYYLQFAPFGKNIEGAAAASLAFFGHTARELTSTEIAYLLSVPQNPTARFPSPDHAPAMPKVIGRVCDRLVHEGLLDQRQALSVRQAKIPSELKPLPRSALHASQYLITRYPDAVIHSTIRRDVQNVVESMLANYKTEFDAMGIMNSAAIVLDNRTSRVLAAAGNFDFFDEENQGQVIGFLAPRSPGSAMKPFIYARSLDLGLALPQYMVPDIPVHFSGYEPINYDHDFRGLVRLEEALSMSLNIPFVNLLQRVGLSEYLDFLHRAGLSTLVDQYGYYGLSIAIGSLEVKLDELTNMYAMLARDGDYRDLTWTLDQEPAPLKRLISPGAAYLTRQALRIKDRPDFPERRSAVAVSPEIFWKTGTSMYHRDAWALGATQNYTAGVWVGNFNARPSRYLVGADRAGPILFDILEGLIADKSGEARDKAPQDLTQVEVCALSGRLATEACPVKKTVWALRRNLPREKCSYHVKYLVDEDSGYRLNPLCTAGRSAVERVFTVLPAQVRRWIKDRELLTDAPPPDLPSCPYVTTSSGPRIITPKRNAVFFMIPGMRPERQEIPLEADAGSDVGELFWFVDGRFIASAAAHERVWLVPEPGVHDVRAIDAAGKSHSISIRILPPG